MRVEHPHLPDTQRRLREHACQTERGAVDHRHRPPRGGHDLEDSSERPGARWYGKTAVSPGRATCHHRLSHPRSDARCAQRPAADEPKQYADSAKAVKVLAEVLPKSIDAVNADPSKIPAYVPAPWPVGSAAAGGTHGPRRKARMRPAGLRSACQGAAARVEGGGRRRHRSAQVDGGPPRADPVLKRADERQRTRTPWPACVDRRGPTEPPVRGCGCWDRGRTCYAACAGSRGHVVLRHPGRPRRRQVRRLCGQPAVCACGQQAQGDRHRRCVRAREKQPLARGG